jgi:hypothetical protein
LICNCRPEEEKEDGWRAIALHRVTLILAVLNGKEGFL